MGYISYPRSVGGRLYLQRIQEIKRLIDGLDSAVLPSTLSGILALIGMIGWENLPSSLKDKLLALLINQLYPKLKSIEKLSSVEQDLYRNDIQTLNLKIIEIALSQNIKFSLPIHERLNSSGLFEFRLAQPSNLLDFTDSILISPSGMTLRIVRSERQKMFNQGLDVISAIHDYPNDSEILKRNYLSGKFSIIEFEAVCKPKSLVSYSIEDDCSREEEIIDAILEYDQKFDELIRWISFLLDKIGDIPVISILSIIFSLIAQVGWSNLPSHIKSKLNGIIRDLSFAHSAQSISLFPEEKEKIQVIIKRLNVLINASVLKFGSDHDLYLRSEFENNIEIQFPHDFPGCLISSNISTNNDLYEYLSNLKTNSVNNPELKSALHTLQVLSEQYKINELYESDYNYWPFSSAQCIDKLKAKEGVQQSLAYNLEWIAISIETFAVEHSRGISFSDSIVLLSSIAENFDTLSNQEIISIIRSSESNARVVSEVLKISLCLPYSEASNHIERANRIYMFLPKEPTTYLFEAYVMYQVTFGITNQLVDWNNRILNELNRLQLNLGLALVLQEKENIRILKEELIASSHISQDFQSKVQIASQKLNWLLLMTP